MANKVVDVFLVYQFLKRLATPFENWDAYKLGIIDADGKVLKKRDDLKSTEELNAWGYFDIMVANLKKLLAKVPGGSTRIGSIAAAALLLKEHSQLHNLSEEELNEYFVKHEQALMEEIANVVGGGNIAGAGVGPQGEPGKSKKHNPILQKMLKRKFATYNSK